MDRFANPQGAVPRDVEGRLVAPTHPGYNLRPEPPEHEFWLVHWGVAKR